MEFLKFVLQNLKSPMKSSFLNNYGQTLLLLLGVGIGALCGALLGPSASVVKPVGELFLNLMFVLVVPLVFFSIASSMYRMTKDRKVGSVLGWSIAVFFVTSVVAGVLTWLVCEFWNPLGQFATRIPPERTGVGGLVIGGNSVARTIVNMFTVDDFTKLLSHTNLLPLIVFSGFFGIATALAGEKGGPVARFLHSGMSVVMEVMRILMYAAPVCLGCYFADLTGRIGGQIAGGYLNTLLIFLAVTVVLFFAVNTAYMALLGGMEAVKKYWKNIPGPALLAVSTCSSAATIPVSIQASKEMGMSETVAESVIPIGINVHKDGSVIAGVLRIVFTVAFFGLSGYGCFEIVGIAILTSLVVGAIPVGGMTAEILACSFLGIEPGFAGTLLVISTLVDIPATLLNTSDNVVAAAWVDRLCKRKGEEKQV